MSSNLLAITDELLQHFREVYKPENSFKAITSATGLVGYTLEKPAKFLVPVITPLRNRIRRKSAPAGARQATWKAITAINAAGARPTAVEGERGNSVTTTVVEKQAPYKVVGLNDSVTIEAQQMGAGFEDVRARATVNLLYAVMMGEEKLICGGRKDSLGTPDAPTLTGSGTGGNIGVGTFYVRVAARPFMGRHVGDKTAASNAVSINFGAGTTNSIQASVAHLKGAVQYDWYVGTAANDCKFYASTKISSVTITSIPASGALAPTTDTSGDPLAFDGIHTTLIEAGSGAYYKNQGGAELTGSQGGIAEIDTMLAAIWDNAKVSPESLLMSGNTAWDITNKILASGSAQINLVNAEKPGLIGGAYVESYINKAVGGKRVKIEPHPDFPDNLIIALTEGVPYPDAEVEVALEIETLMEYSTLEWAMTKPTYEFDVRAIEVLKNYFPGGMGVIENIKLAVA